MKRKANKTKMATKIYQYKKNCFTRGNQRLITHENKTKGRIQLTTHGNQQRASKSECMKSTLVNRPAPGRLAN